MRTERPKTPYPNNPLLQYSEEELEEALTIIKEIKEYPLTNNIPDLLKRQAKAAFAREAVTIELPDSNFFLSASMAAQRNPNMADREQRPFTVIFCDTKLVCKEGARDWEHTIASNQDSANYILTAPSLRNAIDIAKKPFQNQLDEVAQQVREFATTKGLNPKHIWNALRDLLGYYVCIPH